MDKWTENLKLNKLEFEESKIRVKSYPIDVSLPFITYCNAKCLFCSYWKFNVKRYMTISEIKLYKDLFRYLCYVGINPAGEPLLHPFFDESIITIRNFIDDRCIFYLVTNGIELNSKFSVIINNINVLTISLNAATNDTHEFVMGVRRSFKRVIKNIEIILNERIKRNSKLQVYITYVVLKQNIHEIPLVIKLINELGVDKLYLRTLATGNYNNPIKPSVNKKYFDLHPTKHPKFFYLIEKIKENIGVSDVPVIADIDNWGKSIALETEANNIKGSLAYREVNTFGEQLSNIPTKGWVKASDFGISLPLRCQYLYKYMIDPRISNIQPVCVYMETLPGFNPIALDLNGNFIGKIRNAPAMVELRRALKEGPYIPETCVKCNILSAFKHSN